MKKGSSDWLTAIGVTFIIFMIMSAIGQKSNDEEITDKPLYENTEYVESLAEDLIKKRLRDPDSYEFVDMNEVQSSKENEKLFIVKYRAKNGFGG